MNISFVISLIIQCAFFFSDKTDNALDVVHTHFQDLRSRFASHYEDVYDSVWTSALFCNRAHGHQGRNNGRGS
ncbi:hypothetical protein ACEPAI_3526 [Sanghuangporus weigelae]